MKLTIGGVPEHFNMPWHLLIESGALPKQGITTKWTDYSGGTGAMVEALNNNDVDIAMLLTDGAIKGIDSGGKYKILGLYVSSPLIWGIHVPANSPYQCMDDVKGLRYAISRFGSGSHIMAYVDAKNRDWPIDNLNFEVVNNLTGARNSFKNRESEIFLWEKFTTKPFVDNGEFRRIGECPTPYPCFVICASETALLEKEEIIYAVIDQVFEESRRLFMHIDRVKIIANRFGLTETDVKEWLTTTRWTPSLSFNEGVFQKVIDLLSELKLISNNVVFEDLLYHRSLVAKQHYAS